MSDDHQHGHGHGHNHGHDHGAPTFEDWDVFAEALLRDGEISRPCLLQVMDWLVSLRSGRPTGHIADIGSGPGAATSLLARTFPDANLTAVDGASGLLEHARRRAAEQGWADRLATAEVDLELAPGDLDQVPEADLIWASRVIHHVPDQAHALRKLASRLAPGGHIVLVEGGLLGRFLPEEYGLGAPGLQHRLDAAMSITLAELLQHDETSPVARPTLDWPDQLAEAGLTPTGTRTFLLDLPAPVTQPVREHVAHRLGQAGPLGGEHLTEADQDAVERLLDESEPLSVWNRPDLFYISASTVHTAQKR